MASAETVADDMGKLDKASTVQLGEKLKSKWGGVRGKFKRPSFRKSSGGDSPTEKATPATMDE